LDWDKKKGVFAKIAGKTGVGDLMKAAKAAYDKIDKAAYAITKAQDKYTEEEVAALWEAGKKASPNVQATRDALFKLQKKAEETSTKFKANKLIPSSSTAHVTQVGKDASNLALALKSMDMPLRELENHVKGKYDLLRNALRQNIPKAEAAIADLEKTPTPENYNKHWNTFRTGGVAVAALAPCKPFQPEFKTLTSKQHTDFKSNEEIKQHVAKLKVLFGKLKSAVG
jgi:hypothetical protein